MRIEKNSVKTEKICKNRKNSVKQKNFYKTEKRYNE